MYRVAVFIDGGYLDRELDSRRQGHRIDYDKLVDNIVAQSGGDRTIIRVYYYHCLPYQDSPPT